MTPKEESIEQIVKAYLKTHLTEKQFEALVTQALTDAEGRGGMTAGDYGRGFSDGYDCCLAEGKNP